MSATPEAARASRPTPPVSMPSACRCARNCSAWCVVAHAGGEGDARLPRGERPTAWFAPLPPNPLCSDSVAQRLARARQRTRDDGQIDVGASDHDNVCLPRRRADPTPKTRCATSRRTRSASTSTATSTMRHYGSRPAPCPGSRFRRVAGLGRRSAIVIPRVCSPFRFDPHRQRPGAGQPVVDRERDRSAGRAGAFRSRLEAHVRVK